MQMNTVIPSVRPPSTHTLFFLKFETLSSYIKEGLKCDINLVAN